MRFSLIAIAAAAVMLPAVAVAAEPDFAGVRVSTLGVGAEFGVKLNDHFTVRALANGYNYNYDTTTDDIHYDGKLKLGSFGAQVDYRFIADSPLYVTAGLYANDNKVRAHARPTQDTRVGGVVFTPTQIGTLTTDAKFKDTAPYLGIGARWPVGVVEINLEAGAYFQGKPKVTLTSDGTYADNSTYQDALERERQSLQKDADDFSTYPVVALGLRYKF